jgi:hypothetical protein
MYTADIKHDSYGRHYNAGKKTAECREKRILELHTQKNTNIKQCDCLTARQMHGLYTM